MITRIDIYTDYLLYTRLDEEKITFFTARFHVHDTRQTARSFLDRQVVQTARRRERKERV